MRLRVVLAVTLGVALVIGGVGLYLVSPAPAVRAAALVIEIPPYEGVRDVASRLEQAGAIRSGAAFTVLAAVRGSARRLQAGEYEIPQGASTADVLDLLEAGRVRIYTVLFPEGATIEELARALEAERLASADEVVRVARDPEFLQAHRIEAESAEGYLFPDTYRFVRGMRVDDMLGRMVQRLRGKLGPDIAERAEAQGLTVHELLTLASIVEREAVAREERRIIAGVFWNRLRRGMALQADPTVQYAVGKGRRALTRADLDTDHPYNTYRRSGLPPGPIASPGLESIEAALDPAVVPYLYFVKLDERRHQFSRTLAEHNAAVARYRLLQGR